MFSANIQPRVVVVVSHLGMGGAERQTVELLRQLRGTPWAPQRVICLSSKVIPHGSAVRELDYPLSIVARTRGFEIGRWRELSRLLHQEEAGIVHAVSWLASAYCVLAKPKRARVVSSIRNSHFPAGVVRRHLLPPLIRRSAGIVVNSERGRQFVIEECRVAVDRVALIPNGVDVDRVRRQSIPGAFRRELRIPDSAPLIAYVGRNARVKNIPRLLSVTQKLLAADPDLHIAITGEGLDSSVVAHSVLAGMKRVHCLGPRSDIPLLLGDATLLLLTSDSEGTPNVVLEALGAGVPVVATEVGDLACLVPEQCGVVVKRDVEALVNAVRRVIADAASYRRAVAHHLGHLRARYSLEAMTAQTIDVWKRIDSAGPGSVCATVESTH